MNSQNSNKTKSNNKSQSKEKEGTFLTEPPNKKKETQQNPQAVQIQEQLQKQATLLKQIQDAEERLKLTQEQRKKVVSTKRQEIEKKEQTINQMRTTNEQLQKELDILQTQVQSSLDSIEYKEKNKLYEKEKKKIEEPLNTMINDKKKELAEIVQKSLKVKKEKEKIQKDLSEKVDLEKINSLTSEIKIIEEKIDDLEKEKKYLLKLREDHVKCGEINQKLKNDIEEIKANLEKVRQQNKEKSKKEQKGQSMKIKEINHNLTAKQIKERNEQQIKNIIDKYWQKNSNLLNTANFEEKKVKLKSPSNTERKKRKLNVYSEEVLKKNMELNNKDLSNNDKLPKIPLFKEGEKKILLGLLPEKEINKYQKRFEYVEKEKENLLRKFTVENKKFEKENKSLENKYVFSNNQLTEGMQKNKILENQLIEQQQELENLTNKLIQMKKNLDNKKIEVKLKDEENKKLVKKLKDLQTQKLYQENKLGNIEDSEVKENIEEKREEINELVYPDNEEKKEEINEDGFQEEEGFYQEENEIN